MSSKCPHTDAWGIVRKYKDAMGHWREISEKTHAAILAAMGNGGSAPPPDAPGVRVVRQGEVLPIQGPGELKLEDGATLRVTKSLPADLPPGYHELRLPRETKTLRLIVAPAHCYLPANLRAWGWAVQLYALRSKESWGMGDLADLRRLARWSRRELGAGFLLVNPLNAATPVVPQESSPYFPSSRLFRNPLYLRIEEVPGAAEAGVKLERLAAQGRALNAEPVINRDAVLRLKMAALERIWSRFEGDPGFDRFCVEQGESLARFASFCVLAERHGGGWPKWPARYRSPESAAVARFAEEHAGRVRFHQWLQWLLDEQLAKAENELPVMHDLPIGVDPWGADAWAWQELLASGVSVGAPPDELNQEGQNWGLPAFVPHKLRSAAYEPFCQIIRAALRHGGWLRFDHVMGLFRLFWVPQGFPAREGAYVRYPVEELLAILALESHRAEGVVVGEDLGTVEEGVRERLFRERVLSYRLLWFEPRPVSEFPRQAMAAVTTHDLFTIAGLWTGSDLRALQELGLNPNVEGTNQIRDALRRKIRLGETAELTEVIAGTHRLLARAPSMLLTATLEDALAVEERPNVPNTTPRQRPNWSRALPLRLEGIQRDRLVRTVAAALKR